MRPQRGGRRLRRCPPLSPLYSAWGGAVAWDGQAGTAGDLAPGDLAPGRWERRSPGPCPASIRPRAGGPGQVPIENDPCPASTGADEQGPGRRSEMDTGSAPTEQPPRPGAAGRAAHNEPAAIGAIPGRAPGEARGGGRGSAEGGRDQPRPGTRYRGGGVPLYLLYTGGATKEKKPGYTGRAGPPIASVVWRRGNSPFYGRPKRMKTRKGSSPL